MLKCIDEENKTLEMVEGDFGVGIQIEIETEDDEIITSSDNFSIKIYDNINGELLINKNYDNIQNNTIELKLTEEEAAKLPIGVYCYDLNWYQNQVFLDNLIAKAQWFVKEKAEPIQNTEEGGA